MKRNPYKAGVLQRTTHTYRGLTRILTNEYGICYLEAQKLETKLRSARRAAIKAENERQARFIKTQQRRLKQQLAADKRWEERMEAAEARARAA